MDYKKVILIAFLVRLLFASVCDIFTTVSGSDILLPDSRFYSLNGLHRMLLLQGYDKEYFPESSLPKDRAGRDIFWKVVREYREFSDQPMNETKLYYWIIGVIYFLFGYFPFWVRFLNVSLSILCAYFVFKIAKKQFGVLAANIFLLIGLSLPTQVIYSATMSKDLIRMFFFYLILWRIYG